MKLLYWWVFAVTAIFGLGVTNVVDSAIVRTVFELTTCDEVNLLECGCCNWWLSVHCDVHSAPDEIAASSFFTVGI